MYYNNEEFGLFEDFSEQCDQADQQRQFVFCMMMDQVVRISGR